MKTNRLSAWRMLAAGAALLPALALAIPCNTGVTGTLNVCGGALLPAGAVDPHWQLATPFPSAPSSSLPVAPPFGPFGPTYANVNSPAWLPNSASPVSGWITPSQREGLEELGGQYVYHTTFTGDRSFGGRYLSDNETIAIYLNDVLQPASFLNGPADFGGNWKYFTIDSGLLAGLNTLDFVVRNRGVGGRDADGTVTGFRAEFYVPEPGSLALCGIGMLALAGMGRARRAVA